MSDQPRPTRVRVRISGTHARALHEHLFPKDGREAVAFALCGRRRAVDHEVLLVQEVYPIPYGDCPVRTPERVTWSTDALEPALMKAAAQGLGVIKLHGHPTGHATFSSTDDASDADLFPSIYGWVDDDGPHASLIMLKDGTLFGRWVDVENRSHPIERITVAGDDVRIFDHETSDGVRDHAERHAQLFGQATTALLGRLHIGVVGCSGTGSLVVEMLARLGVQALTMVDCDVVERRNLNRIVNSTKEDAKHKRAKVDVLARSIRNMDLGVEVHPVRAELATTEAVHALADCDIVFGCMDSHDGRRMLNRLASFYVLPYFDCGVGLEADGHGGIDEVCAASHYVQPGGSTLLARRVIHAKRADAEAMARRDPRVYSELRAEKYIAGVEEDRPAVISVNALAAALCVNEMLARLHPYRADPNDRFASVRLSLANMDLDVEHESWAGALARTLGRGDIDPFLDMPELSDRPKP